MAEAGGPSPRPSRRYRLVPGRTPNGRTIDQSDYLAMRLFGIETEYGITRDDLDEVDPVVESMELVRAHLTASFERRWDYAGEDPHEDARGFRVSGLAQDKEEDEFAKVDAHRPFSFHEMK